MGGLMNSFIGEPTFSGSWEEDLDNCINIINTLAAMCEISEHEKLKSVPVIPTGDALNFYANNVAGCRNFDGAMIKMCEWYNSDDRKLRILTTWQSMNFSEAMADELTETDVTVFRRFVAKLMTVQNQLDSTYQSNQFLIDRLMTAIDIPHIKSTFRDRMPRTSQQAFNWISNQLSDKPRTAGTSAACIVENDENYNESNYSLGKTYVGDARRPTKLP